MSMPRAAMSVATRIAARPDLEVIERADALALALVAVDREGVDPVLAELLGEAVGPVLGPGEDERLGDAARPDEMREELALALAVDRDHDLLDELRGLVARRNIDTCRVVHEAGGQLPDLVREGRREQQVLALAGEQGEDLADVPDEAHVEHPVGLVQDQHLDLREVDGPLLDVVEEAAGRRDDDRRPGAQGAGLGLEADAAVDRDGAHRAVAAVGPDALLHLERELAGGREDEAPDGAVDGFRVGGRRDAGVRVAVVQPLEDGQHEGRGLAGPGLGAGEQVAAGEDERDRLGLDGGGLGVALVGNGAQIGRRQPEAVEGHGSGTLLRGPPAVSGARSGRRVDRGRAGVTADADRSVHRARRPESYTIGWSDPPDAPDSDPIRGREGRES